MEGGLQQLPSPAARNPAAPTPDSFKGSIVSGQATGAVMDLSLDDAIARGLRQNLGLILQTTAQQSAKGQELEMLQPLLPTITGDASIEVEQVNLAAFGLKFPGLNPIIGPFQVVDFRAYLTQNLVNVPALENYLAAKHNFARRKADCGRCARDGRAHRGKCVSAVHRGRGAHRCGQRGAGDRRRFRWIRPRRRTMPASARVSTCCAPRWTTRTSSRP